jgi:beta-lactamase class D
MAAMRAGQAKDRLLIERKAKSPVMKWKSFFGSVWVLVMICGSGCGSSERFKESPDLNGAFERVGVVGTFVVRDAKTGALIGHDLERAGRRFVPASTFKIPNTLIGLETGVVQSVDEIFPYDGQPRMFPAWEKDMSLRQALPASNVPVYQELARRIGLEPMREAVKKLHYGNGDIGKVVDRFWLDGPLAISALEQVDFMKRLALSELPFSENSMEAVREITKIEEAGGNVLHGKTGWAISTVPHLGWFVGWVQRGDEIYPFALNIDLSSEEDGAKRIPLARECLRLLGIY